MNNDEINFWMDLSDTLSVEVERSIDDARADPDLSVVTKIGADGTPTHKIDEYAEQTAIEVLERCGKSLVLISEEIGEVKIGDGEAEFLLILDPIDGSSNSIKNIACYGISIAIADIRGKSSLDEVCLADVEVAYVKNFPTGDVYSAVRGGGALKNGEVMNPISGVERVSDATLCSYVYRSRSDKLCNLYTNVRRMRIMGSIAIEMCYVADATYDVFLEIGGIIRILDIAASQLIVAENGGVVSDYDGNKLSSRLSLTEKTSIVACCSQKLHEDILAYLH